MARNTFEARMVSLDIECYQSQAETLRRRLHTCPTDQERDICAKLYALGLVVSALKRYQEVLASEPEHAVLD